jgi:uncharacterized protein (DUF58 family)
MNARRLDAHVVVLVLGTIGGILLGRPALVALAVPSALMLALAVAARAPAAPEPASVVPERTRILEGETLGVVATVRGTGAAEELAVGLVPPRGIAVEPPGGVALRLAAGEERSLRFTLRAERWGGFEGGTLALRAVDPLGVRATSARAGAGLALRVNPEAESVRLLVAPLQLRVTTGSRVSSARGEGIEFAEVRPRVSGDPVRRMNWRATARRGEPYVTDRHVERNADVVLLLDTFEDIRSTVGGTLEDAVRAAASLAGAYLRRRDRVGVIGFGGVLHWLRLGSGVRQGYRLLDALTSSQVVANVAWKSVNLIPRGLLPGQGLVVALSPLLDPRIVGVIADLRARGFDVALVDVSPVIHAPAPAGDAHVLALRLWELQRDAVRSRLRRHGVTVAEWTPPDPLAAVLAELDGARRRVRVG